MSEAAIPSPQPKTSALAVWSLVLGILGLLALAACVGFLPAVGAVICGHLALSAIKKAPAELSGQGLAIGGLATGYTAIVLNVVLVPILIALALPGVAGALEKARQTQAVSSARSVAVAAIQYAHDHDGQLPPDMNTLVDEDYIPRDFTTVEGGDAQTVPLVITQPGARLADLPPETVIISDQGRAFDNHEVQARADGSVTLTKKTAY